MDKNEYQKIIGSRQKGREGLSPEEKLKLYNYAQSRVNRRKNQPTKQTSIRQISRKAGHNRARIEALEKSVEILQTEAQILRHIIESPKLKEPVKIKKGSEICPTCGKSFKQLKKHKCKGIKNGNSKKRSD